MKQLVSMALGMGIILVSAITPATARDIDWTAIKGKDITLFYPGQASWEWLLTQHSAAKSVRKGSLCRECHEGEEKQMGATIVTGKKLEPNPMDGRPGSVPVNIKVAYDNHNIYVHAEWKSPGFTSGRFMDRDYAVKFGMMVDDGKVKEAPVAGCWGACHTDATHMPAHEGKPRELYLSASRKKLTKNGGGDNFIAAEDMADLLKGGVFMEYWQARYSARIAPNVTSGYILDERHEHGSPVVNGDINFDAGTRSWSVNFVRPRASQGQGTKNLQDDKTLSVGFALHDDYVAGRYHYVSFGYAIGLGENGDITAVKVQ